MSSSRDIDEIFFNAFVVKEIELVCDMLVDFECAAFESSVEFDGAESAKMQRIDLISQSLLELVSVLKRRLDGGKNFDKSDLEAFGSEIRLESVRKRFLAAFNGFKEDEVEDVARKVIEIF